MGTVVGFPLVAAFGEDAPQQGRPVLERTLLGAGQFGFGGDEASFTRGFEDGLAVALQVGAQPPQSSHRRIQAGELHFDGVHDAFLFGEGCERERIIRQEIRWYTQLTGCSGKICFGICAKSVLANEIEDPFGQGTLVRRKHMKFRCSKTDTIF
jgi:hypothetical protein